MRITVASTVSLIGLLCSSQPASAQSAESAQSIATDDYHASGGLFIGGGVFTDEIELGNSFHDDQVPQSGFLLGARAAGVILQHIAPGTAVDPQLSIEGELKMQFSSTDGSDMRPSEFAPIFGWRAQLILDLWPQKRFNPFILAGGGGETVFTESRFMRTPDTDALLLFGAGGRYDLGERYGIRADLRAGVTAGRSDRSAPVFEGHLGVYYRFGRVRDRLPETVSDQPPPVDEPKGPIDTDGDGLADADDQCPEQPELVNDIDDGDGCPEIDTDGDGRLGSADKCPDRAEDIDNFQDDDGCPEADNDGDGLTDDRDNCPTDPESQNGFQDQDGCPDEIPEQITRLIGVLDGVQFRSGNARITGRTRKALKPLLDALVAHPGVRIELSGHTDNRGNPAKNQRLSADRATAVKEYLVGQGVEAERIETVGHGDQKPIADNATASGRSQNRRIEVRLLPGAAPVPPNGDKDPEGDEPQTDEPDPVF